MPLPDDQRISRAQALIEIGRYQEAIVELVAIAAREPDNYYLLCSLSLCNYHLGNIREGQAQADQAIAVEPENEWAYRIRSLCLTARGLHDLALDAAREAVKKAPYEPFALRTLASAQITFYEFEEAEETVQLLLALAPEQAESHELAGLLKLAQEDVAGAEGHFLNALEIDPQSATAHNNLGMVYLEQSQGALLADPGRGRKARDAFLNALKLQPTLAEAQQNLAAAENNPKFLGGKGTRVFLRIQAIALITIITTNLAARLLPYAVALFVDHQPRFFTIWMNVYLIFLLIVWLVGFVSMRKKQREFILMAPAGGARRYVLSLFLLLVLHFVSGMFLIVIDSELPNALYFGLILLSGLILFSALHVFNYFNSRMTD